MQHSLLCLRHPDAKTRLGHPFLVLFGFLLLLAAGTSAAALDVGFAHEDITPKVNGARTVWIAGYGHNRPAEGVHDRLFARTLVLRDGEQKLALVSVDLVGLQYPEVRAIRAKLSDFAYVMVSSTHNHEGPDVIGIWGSSPFTRGVDPEYLELVVERVVRSVRRAEENLAPAEAAYGTAEDESLLGDSRLPKVYDGVLRAIRFTSGDGKTAGLLVQWNCHPEALGPKNELLTADFPAATVAALEKRYSAPVVYFTGAVGGLMAPPDGVIKDASGKLLEEGDFAYAEAYGEAVARLAERAIDDAAPLRLTPLVVSAKPITMPLENPIYRLSQALGVISRPGRIWTGDFDELGEPRRAKTKDEMTAVETEVAYLRLGELHVACIPGEIYPELVYGKFQDPADPAADFPDAPLEKPVSEILPGDKLLLLGLANDEIGYIIPRRQWDHVAPFAYGRQKSQYGEINSCGPQVAPIIMQALQRRVEEARGVSDESRQR